MDVCHICHNASYDTKYCNLCGHWFCGKCRRKIFPRGLAAVKQMVMGRYPNCCGPLR